MKAQFLLNDRQISYLIHGQPFKLDYIIENSLFVVIVYNTGTSFIKKFSIRKSSGVFTNVTNSFHPSIKIYAFGLGYKVFNFGLNINFINCKLPQLTIPSFIDPTVCEFHIKHKAPFFKLFKFFDNNNFFKDICIKPIRIKNNHLSLNHTDDFNNFKEVYISKTNI